jgi:hypothetical protein
LTALRGDWIDDKTFHLDYQLIGEPADSTGTFRFNGDEVSLAIDNPVYGVKRIIKGHASTLDE